MIYLASQSKTRQRLLAAAGVDFATVHCPLDEEQAKVSLMNQDARELAIELARQKALSVNHDGLVLAADQTLELEGSVINKSPSIAEARQTLQRLRGKTHVLHSALAVARHKTIVFDHVSTAKMTMRSFSDAFLDHYIAQAQTALTTSVGCYHYEDLGVQLFESVEGDHATILGLPLLPLLDFLRKTGELKP